MDNEHNNKDPREEEGFIDFDPETGQVILENADGTEAYFFLECELEVDDRRYVVLIPDEGDEEAGEEVGAEEEHGVVFRVEEDEEGNEIWHNVDDEEELTMIEEVLVSLEAEEEDELEE